MVKQEKFRVKLAELQPPKRNVRMHPERQIQEIIRCLDKYGQYRDIVIDEDNTILAGNGLKIAMERHGDTEANVIRFVGLKENEKLKLMLADNKTFSLGIEDLDGINEVLEQLGNDLDVPGFDEETLKALVATAEDVTEKLMEYGTMDEERIEEIRGKQQRKEALMQKPPDVAEPVITPTPTCTEAGDDEPVGEVRKSVVCPNCGERLWL